MLRQRAAFDAGFKALSSQRRRSANSERYRLPANREFTRLVGDFSGLATLSSRRQGTSPQIAGARGTSKQIQRCRPAKDFFASATVSAWLLDAIWLNAVLAKTLYTNIEMMESARMGIAAISPTVWLRRKRSVFARAQMSADPILVR